MTEDIVTPPYPGRWIGLDPGTVRVGVAVSDVGGVVATPRDVLRVRKPEDVVDAVGRLLREYAATEDDSEMPVGIVIGDPRHMHGAESEGTRLAHALRDRLAAAFDLVVTLWDERLTTVMADAALAETGVRQDRRRETRDAVAAALLLQSYLEYLRGRASDPEAESPA